MVRPLVDPFPTTLIGTRLRGQVSDYVPCPAIRLTGPVFARMMVDVGYGAPPVTRGGGIEVVPY